MYAELDPPVGGRVGEALRDQGIKQLYSHQAQAIEAVRRGENVVVVTGTASGKTLCYNIPVLESLEKDPKGRALYIYPTKALAQDQLGKLRDFHLDFVKAATYDGDTPRQERPFIKMSANIVLTNPDMLHVGILPYHTTWSDLFRNLKYVVIDEVHTYRGVFGAHVANIMRRLRQDRRVLRLRSPVRVRVGDRSGTGAARAGPYGRGSRRDRLRRFPIGPQDVFVLESSVSGGQRREAQRELRGRRSVHQDDPGAGVRTIVFTKARKTAELILRYTKNTCCATANPLMPTRSWPTGPATGPPNAGRSKGGCSAASYWA